MTNEGSGATRADGEPSIWFLRLAVIAQSFMRRPLLVFVGFGLLGGFALADVLEPAWLPWVTGVVFAWVLLYLSRLIVRRARASLALEAAARPEKARGR
jgi:hypothetical protein